MLKKRRINRAFILEGFSVWDLFMPAYIDRKSIYDFIKRTGKKLGKVNKVLDFGCGCKPYRNLFDAQKYIGIDVEVPENSSGEVEPDILYDGKILPFEAETFDTVLSSQVFEHIYDISMSINEIYRVTKKGGVLCATVPFVAAEHSKPYDFFRYTEFGIRQMLEEAGWEIISLEKATSDGDTIRQEKIFALTAKMHNEKSILAFLHLLLVMPVWNWNFYLKQKRKIDYKNYNLPLGFFLFARKK